MSIARVPVSHYVLVSRAPFLLQPPVVAVLGAMTFNFVLCFANTNVSGIGTAYAIGCEIAIILTVLLYTYPTLDYPRFLVISGALLYLVALMAARALLGDGFDVKPVRDLLIPIAFFMLGAGAGDARMGDTIVRLAVIIVIAVGAFEYLLPDVYTRFFNIASFYVERGSMAATQIQGSSNLFVSGMRPDSATAGRTLLPFLGNHRISSIFLEPVSAGNFGIIVFMWALVRSLNERKLFWGLIASALLIIVMSDSRFGAAFCVICLVLAFCPGSVRTAATAVLPALGLLSIVLLPDFLLATHARLNNGFIGRTVLSGRILDRFDAFNWFGVRTPDFVTSDSGYAYTLAGIGIIGIVIFWALLLSIRGHGRRFYLFRDMTGFYFALLLCISNSPFTIKTGALLWFLVGVLSRGYSFGHSRRGPPVSAFAHSW